MGNRYYYERGDTYDEDGPDLGPRRELVILDGVTMLVHITKTTLETQCGLSIYPPKAQWLGRRTGRDICRTCEVKVFGQPVYEAAPADVVNAYCHVCGTNVEADASGNCYECGFWTEQPR